MLKNIYNKAFKADSQRLAFSVQGWVLCLRCNGLGLVVSVAHYLTRRYITTVITGRVYGYHDQV
ncbi:hypothetical protein FCU56_21270 [Vibrio vulnificus]|nr:hypothetical protein [Vibrio vulnificus]